MTVLQGNRENIDSMAGGSQKILTQVLIKFLVCAFSPHAWLACRAASLPYCLLSLASNTPKPWHSTCAFGGEPLHKCPDRCAACFGAQVLKLIDSHDLYGSVAYPKKHQQKDISDIYLLPFATRGIFTNVALQEPFGLTVIEVGVVSANFMHA